MDLSFSLQCLQPSPLQLFLSAWESAGVGEKRETPHNGSQIRINAVTQSAQFLARKAQVCAFHIRFFNKL